MFFFKGVFGKEFVYILDTFQKCFFLKKKYQIDVFF